MTKEEVLAVFELDIQREDPRMSESTTQDIINTAKRLIIKDRSGVIDTLRYWLHLRDERSPLTAVYVIANVYIPELKPDLEYLKEEIESGKEVFHPSYNIWLYKALDNMSNNSE